MTTKHLYSSADGLVLKALRGAVFLNPSLRLHEPSKTVYSVAHSPIKRVAVISGGGAGHEPAHASYTGRGMLSAAVSGDIFASPNPKQILSAIKLGAYAAGFDLPSKDILLIINNYTGDRLNFGLAIEKARHLLPGVKIESVVVADDISLLQKNQSNKFVGPRGLAANILVCKILGALAEQGGNLKALKALGGAVVENLASLGVGLDHCHVPGRAKDSHGALGNDECEVGLGLHNEQGVSRQKIGTAKWLIDEMVDMIVNSQTQVHGEIVEATSDCSKADEVVVFINNLGGMSQLEMGAVVDDVVSSFANRGINPHRLYCSSYMTSLNAPGFSITVLNLSRVKRSLQSKLVQFTCNIDELLDAPTDATAWIGVRAQWDRSRLQKDQTEDLFTKMFLEYEPKGALLQGQMSGRDHIALDISSSRRIPILTVKNVIQESCRRVLAVEKDLTEFDTILGDGDCGVTFAAGAKALLARLDDILGKGKDGDPSAIVGNIADTLEEAMGGTIGALFGIFLNALSASLKPRDQSWGNALLDAMHALSQYTPAAIGDRTIVDALGPFCNGIALGKGLESAVNDARRGAEATRGMKPQLGRAVYLSSMTMDLPPDPGAWGVCATLEGISVGNSVTGSNTIIN